VDPRRALGDAGERAAEAALARLGLLVVARKARTRWGEIDLVCRDRSGYVFVEVKTRRAGGLVGAAEAADRRKVARLARLAQSWIAARGERGVAWRLLLVAITTSASAQEIELIDIDRA